MIYACRTKHRRAGFSLTEVLIVVGILVLLTGLILAGVIHSRKIANVIRVKDDLGMIETALAAYKDEFGDIPRFADQGTDYATRQSGVKGSGNWLDDSQWRGAVLLCRAMIGPGAASTNPGITQDAPNPTPADLLANFGDDGADGPGFRTKRIFNRTTGQFTGKIYGPYLDAGKFKIGYAKDPVSGQTVTWAPVLLDIYGNAILYYPASPGNSQGILGYSDPKGYSPPPASPPGIARFNGFDNEAYIDGTSPTAPFDLLAASCGTPAYLLWTAGADGQFGLIDGKSDDVANFDMPGNLKK